MGRDKPKRARPGQPAPPEHAKRPKRPSPENVTLSFEYYEPGGRYCASNCKADEVHSFLACLRKISERTWEQMIQGSSKNPAMKTGLNSTLYEKSALKNQDIWPARIGEDVAQLVGMRASEKRRVFGLRLDNVYYVLWFDEAHNIVKG